MSRYTDKNGGLSVDKTSPAKTQNKVPEKNEIVAGGKITGTEILETAQSYQLPQFTANPSEKGGSECRICGKKTSFDNRHVCVSCWTEYNKEMIDSLKSAVSNIEIKIE